MIALIVFSVILQHHVKRVRKLHNTQTGGHLGAKGEVSNLR
jgi:hypothetical protein